MTVLIPSHFLFSADVAQFSSLRDSLLSCLEYSACGRHPLVVLWWISSPLSSRLTPNSLYLAPCPKQLTYRDYINELPCTLASSDQVWLMGITSKSSGRENRIRSGYLFPPCEVSSSWLCPSTDGHCFSHGDLHSLYIFTSSFRWPLTSLIHLGLEVVIVLLLLVTDSCNILLVFFDPPYTFVIHLFVMHPPGIILIIIECAFGFLLGLWMICSPIYYHGSVLFSKVTTYTHDFLLDLYRLCTP